MLQPAQNPATAPKYSPSPNTYTPPKNITSSMEQATIGRSVVIKGDVSGGESLYIDGRIEGTVNFADSRVTIGRNATVVANISAKEVVIMGKVTGNIQCTERLDIRSEGSLTGDVVTPRVCVEDGAMVKGGVEVRASHQQAAQPQNEKPPAQPKPAEPPKAAAAAASAASSATLARGSKVMYNESN
jgi:cytoskeletal protein CcmA (bactofilin family)